MLFLTFLTILSTLDVASMDQKEQEEAAWRSQKKLIWAMVRNSETQPDTFADVVQQIIAGVRTPTQKTGGCDILMHIAQNTAFATALRAEAAKILFHYGNGTLQQKMRLCFMRATEYEFELCYSPDAPEDVSAVAVSKSLQKYLLAQKAPSFEDLPEDNLFNMIYTLAGRAPGQWDATIENAVAAYHPTWIGRSRPIG